MGKLQRMLMAAVLPPHALMSQMISGMVTSKSLALVADLGIADLLAGGPRDVAALASATKTDPAALYRVLRTLSVFGVFTELPGRKFENSPLSEVLRSDAEHSVRNLARWLGHPLHWKTVGDLEHSVRTGKPSVNKDQPDRSPFDVLSDDADAQAVFNDAMTGHSKAAGETVVKAYDFSPYRKITDVGGGQGTLAVMIAKTAPGVHVTVYDLPHVVEGAAKTIKDAGLEARIDTAGGSFFDKVPGPADLCVLKFILHLCDDAAAAKVLANCRAALGDKGRLLVCEMMVSSSPISMPAKIMDIEMMIGSGGRERTEEEFSQLFSAAGLKLLRVIKTKSPLRLLEVAVK